MPRDIRSYFTSVATSQKNSGPVAPKSQKRRIISSSSDEDEEKPQSSTKRSTVVKRKKSSILSDSEDEERVVRDKKDSNNPTANKKSKSKEPCKAVPVTELFGKKPIMRVEETKVNRKLQKVESKFHDDEDFDAVLKQLDAVQYSDTDTLIQDKQKDKSNIKNVDSLKKSEAAVKTEVASNKNRKHNNGLKDCNNKTNNTSELRSEEVKESPNKNNVYSKVTNSSPKQNLQKEKRGSSTGDLDISKKDKDTKKSSRKKAKIMEENLFEERKEMKKQRTIMYEKYLQRGGARNPGSKEIPTGAENCLAGVSFLITGVLDSLERNEAEDLIQKYGGRTVKSVSNKVNYIVVGDEAGPSKLTKASNLGIKQISEDDLLEMIRTRPEGKATDIKPTKAKSNVKKIFESDESPSPNKTKALLDSPKKIKIPPSLPVKTSVNTETSPASKQILDASNNTQKIITSIGSEPLVERYRPKTMKQIIGQQGDKSCAHNLYVWLRDWHQNRQNSKFKDSTSKQTHGQNFKAALLSGPPGVGKTTTVQVVCKELGYDLVEFNASDTRNKTLLKEAVSGLLSNTTMKDYVTGTKQKITSKHVLLMDEVDGMAGNEDRGGLQELLNLIKHTDVPVICICNDRFNTKVKTISTHSYDLKYPRLRVEQIRSSMKSLCFKENIKISTEDLDRLIESTNYDIRQVINHLEFLGTQMTHVKTTDKKHSNKTFKLGPFDVTKMAFNADEQKNMSLNDKIGLYFHDYNIAPLFIQENYQGVRLPQILLRQRLEKIANAADSISQGDLVEKVMRSNMMWSLLPLHACFSFVIPANEMSGSSDGLIRFPSWFGRNSKTTRFNRLLQELTTHTRLATGANKDALNMDYLPHIRNAIVKPLIDNGVNGIEEAINIMGKYHLTREDLDSAIEISLWPGMSDSTSNLDSKVKAAFTRAYQKNPPMLPYAINNTIATKKRSRQDNDIMGEEEDDEEEETDDIDFDKMIKAKKPTVASTSKAASSTRKRGESAKKCGKVRGKGK